MMGLLLALSLSSLVPGIVLVGGCVGSFFVVVKLDMGSFRRVHVHVDIWNGGRKKRHVCDFLLNWLGFDRRESQFFRALDEGDGAVITLSPNQELLSDEVVARRDSDVNPIVVIMHLDGVRVWIAIQEVDLVDSLMNVN